ncbi:hypothetical protein [uncultured Nocardioides sp.]|uniref:hypothetical protein n=1 Tax=uncultured Nocardioides sp. TaxID=198441 RepID=UPI00260CAE87|nr:hypothetical protein [uncultured Nocardioides sp.]
MTAPTISERWDAGSAVSGGAPEVGTDGYLDGLREEAGYVVRLVDWAVRTLTGVDLFAEVLEPFSGDFAALASMQQGWRQVEAALGAVGENHADLAGQLPGTWDGGSRVAAGDALGTLADTAAQQAEAAGLVAEQLGHVLSVSTAAAETVCAALGVIDDVVLALGVKLLAGPVGAGLAAVTAPADAARILAMLDRIRSAVLRLVEAAETCAEVMAMVQVGLDVAAAAAEAVAMGSHYAAAGRVDDVTAVGFA